MESVLFYLFGTVLVAASAAVVTVRNPVYAVLFLVLAFFNMAGIWVLLEAEFLALVLVLVYVGAVMVLFLFVVMMLDINLDPLREGFVRYLPVGIVVALVILGELALVLAGGHFGLEQIPAPPARGPDYSNTAELGRILYTEYAYAFEIASVILLVAIIAAIVLAMRRRPDSKYQDPAAQVRVRREDRVRIVEMPAETKPTIKGDATS